MLDNTALHTLFYDARAHNAWQDKPVSDAELQKIFDMMKWAPTSANCSPARIVFVKSAQEREKLAACMAPGNAEKTKSAPVTAIIGMDMAFYEELPKLFPHGDARSWFVGNQALIDATAFRNASLQGGYFILAARAIGLDCGPMSGFDAAKLNEAFFAGTKTVVNFVCSLGHGDPDKVYPRSPRFSFEEVCKIV